MALIHNNPPTRRGRARKAAIVAHDRARLEGARIVVRCTHHGINGPKLLELRARARAVGAQVVVIKNSLARLALADGPFVALLSGLRGPSLLVYAHQDPERVYQELCTYLAVGFPRRLARKRRNPDRLQFGLGGSPYGSGFRANPSELQITAVWMYGGVRSPEELALIEARGGLPGLRAELLGGLRAAPRALCGLLQHPIRALLALLRAREAQLSLLAELRAAAIPHSG